MSQAYAEVSKAKQFIKLICFRETFSTFPYGICLTAVAAYIYLAAPKAYSRITFSLQKSSIVSEDRSGLLKGRSMTVINSLKHPLGLVQDHL